MEYIAIYSDENLSHHGIKGQKWGVRRYQNEDGTYTNAGRKRYSIQAARKYYKIDRLKRKQESDSTDFRTYKKLGKKIRKVQTRYDRKIVGLSDDDLVAARQKVASFRANTRKVGAITGAAAIGIGAALVGSYAAPAAGLIIGAGGIIGTAGSLSKLPYYQMESTMLRRRMSNRKAGV